MTFLVFAEHREGRPLPVALQLAAAVCPLAAHTGGELVALACGPGACSVAGSLGQYGVDCLLACEHPCLAGYEPEATVQLLGEAVRTRAPRAVLFADTALGADLAARLAAFLHAGYAPRCTALAIDERGRLVATRITHSERVQVDVTAAEVLTLRLEQGAEPARSPRVPVVEEIELELPPGVARLRVLDTIRADPRTAPLHQAEIVVAGGAGLRDFSLLWQLGDRLGAAVGGSRVVCDEGRLPRERQIGESGATVRPRCYLAFGISGADQHLRGMRDSGLIVAVNTDRHAPLMKLANMGIVGDAAAVIGALVSRLEETKKTADEEGR